MERRRGGRLQRETRAQATRVADEVQSQLARFLILQSLWGYCSVQLAQKIANLAVHDIEHALSMGERFNIRDLKMLAELGGATCDSQRMYSSLMHKLQPSKFNAFESRMSMTILEQPPRPYLQYMLSPHETFSSLYHDYPRAWQTRILPEQTTLNKFWNEMRDHPMLSSHPVRRRRGWQHLCVPINIHGDGVPCVGVGKSWGKSMELLSWASCLASGTTMTTFFYIFGIFAACLSNSFNHHTMKQLWIILAWSLEALYNGEWFPLQLLS